jgi:two-component system, LytTR family, sensor kinase
MKSRHTASQDRWQGIATIWFAFGLIDALQTVFMMRAEGMHHAWPTLFATTLVSWLPWALATPLVMRLAHRFPPVRLFPLSTWFIHAGACCAIALSYAVWTVVLNIVFNPYAYAAPSHAFFRPWLKTFYSGTLTSLVLYTVIVVVAYVVESKDRLAMQQTETARLNEELSRAQLEALRKQIEPHFLFNTLNAVAGLVREQKNDAAVDMIAELSEFLRGVLKESNRQEMTLGEELDFTQRYLNIQKLRFADRLQLSVDVPPELEQAQVPSLILQPMVENAIKHGIAQRAQGGAIRIAASRSNGMLTLSVYNDGPFLPETQFSGIGTANVRTRLQSLYGTAFELRMQNHPPSGVQVSISLPFKE